MIDLAEREGFNLSGESHPHDEAEVSRFSSVFMRVSRTFRFDA